MGIAVAAAGSLAGAYAFSKVQDKVTPDSPKGGGIPGVTTSNGGGKNGDTSTNFPQVDPSIALDYFKQASTTQAAGYNQGLQYYQNAITTASQQLQAGYTQSNQTLAPMSFAATQALNQQMRMLGMDPIQSTAGSGDALRSAYASINGGGPDQKDAQFPSINGYVDKLASQLDAAASIKDPTERAAARQQIQDRIGGANMQIVQPIQDQLNALKEPQYPDYKAYGGTAPTGHVETNMSGAPDWVSPSIGQPYGVTDAPNFVNATQEQAAAYMKAASGFDAEHGKYLEQKASLEGQLKQAQTYSNGLQDFGSNWSSNYGDTYDAGYSPDQVSNVVSNLPGYQFQLQQGTQALNRQAAANGLLNSGNTGIALQTYGQGQASSYYNQYMQMLNSVQQQGAPGTMGIAANQTNEGTQLSSMAQQFGAAQMDTSRSIADFAASELNMSGNLFNQDALFNTGIQFQGQQNELDRKAKAQNQTTASMPAMASVANNAFQYQNNFAQGLIQQSGQAAGFLQRLQ